MPEIPEEGGFVTFDQVPTWKFIEWGVQSVMEGEHDPENTVFVAATARELSLLVFAVVYTSLHIRELQPFGQSILDKLRELTEAQEFSPTTGGSDGAHAEDA